MNCQNCGIEVLRNMKYCPECGEKLESPASTEQRVEEFRASSLSLDVLYAAIKVSFHDQGVVIITIDGDEEMKEAVKLSLAGGSLSMEGKLPGVEIDPNSVSISTVDGAVTVDGKRLDKARELSIGLSLPRDFELEVGQYALGSMVFTTDAGDMKLHNSGHMPIEGKSFNNLEANISGVADLVADDVANGLTADISGNGGISAKSVKGVVSIDISGNGDVEINQIEGSLTADISGNGDFDTKRVDLTKGEVKISGSGDIGIRGGKIQTLTVVSTGMGSFVFDGRVDTGTFTSTGMGDIEIGSCDEVLRRKTSGVGDIEIGSCDEVLRRKTSGMGDIEIG